jgi:hypothetical protein
MKRGAATIVILLLAGAVVNVAVAWVLAILVTSPIDPNSLYVTETGRCETDGHRWWCLVIHRFGMTAVAWDSRNASIWYGTRPPPAERRELDLNAVPKWARTPDDVRLGEYGVVRHVASSRGWPMRALYYRQTRQIRTFETTGCFPTPGALLRVGNGAYLPYNIHPLGFGINTAFFAALLWLLIRGQHTLRRLIRIHRGLCPDCAYPRGESATCTECGRPLPQRAVV